MKKKLLLASTVLFLTAACSQDGTMSGIDSDNTIVTVKDLQHHNYVLVAIDGKPYSTKDNSMSPNIEFGEKMRVSGSMCNNFFGQGELSKESVLTVKAMGMTRKFCSNATLNKLDQQIGELLDGGAKVSLKNNGQNLTLSDDQLSLEFKLKDYM